MQKNSWENSFFGSWSRKKSDLTTYSVEGHMKCDLKNKSTRAQDAEESNLDKNHQSKNFFIFTRFQVRNVQTRKEVKTWKEKSYFAILFKCMFMIPTKGMWKQKLFKFAPIRCKSYVYSTKGHLTLFFKNKKLLYIAT